MKNCAKNDDSTSCRGGRLERPRYFPRQLITPAEMNLGQDYFRQRLRMHNRMLHGWGVVCGALVCEVPDRPWTVKVKQGYVLGPCGDEIWIDCDHLVDLRTCGISGAPGEPAEQSCDPWCSEVYVPRDPGGPLYVAVRYEELMTQPVRAQPTGCGCDDTSCEYSRWRDGYVIGVLDEWDCEEEAPNKDDLLEGPNPPCPPCPTDPWVVLAKVEVDTDGTTLSIDNCSCRRLVASFGDLWWQCQGEVSPPPVGGWFIGDVRAVDPASGAQLEVVKRNTAVQLEIFGGGFVEGVKAEFTGERGVKVRGVEVTRPELLTVHTVIQEKAEAGPHDLLLTHPNGEVLPKKEALVVEELSKPSPRPAASKASSAKARTARSRTKASGDEASGKD